MARHVRLAVYVLAVAAALSGAASAVVKVTPMAVEPIGFTTTGDYLSKITYEAKFAASSTGAAPVANSMYYGRTLPVARSLLPALIKARLRQIPQVAASLALWSVAIEGAGKFISWITKQVSNDQGTPAVTNTGAYYYDTAASMTAVSFGGMVSKVVTYYRTEVGYGAFATCSHTGGEGDPAIGSSSLQNFTCGQVRFYHNASNAQAHSDPAASPTPTPDADLTPIWQNNPALWPETFKWPNGQPKVITGMPEQMAAVQAQYRADTGIAKPAATTEPTYAAEDALDEPAAASDTTGTQANPAPAASASASASVAFPVFCTWASSVCEFFTWVKEPDAVGTDTPLPEKQIQPVSWASGLGGGSCPAPYALTVSGVQQQATFRPYCDIAEGIKPFLLVAAALAAAFILAQGR